jgi:hypothetical protein
MANANDVISELAATRAAAVASSAKANAILDGEIAKPASDPDVMALCADTISQNDVTIQKCDQHIVASILARADADAWLSTLNGLTAQMAAQTAALADDIKLLNGAKSVATAIAGMLSVLAFAGI